MIGGRGAQQHGHGFGWRMDGWKRNWGRNVGSREEIELYMGLEYCRKCTGVLMMNCVGLVEEMKRGAGRGTGHGRQGSSICTHI